MDILNQIRHKISDNLNRLTDSSLLDLLKKNALLARSANLESLDRELKIDKYNLVFIGTVGSGKTTALCFLFDLLEQDDKSDNENPSISTPQELLVTGSGGSTICEVRIELNKYNYSCIETQFITKKELAYYVDDFAEFIAARIDPSNKKIGALLPQEITRALRNILDLKRTEQTDHAIEKYKEIGNLEGFKEYLLQEIEPILEGTHQLSEQDFNYSKHKFIKEIFRQINSAEISHYSIPKKITIFLDKDFFGTNPIWQKVESIIDTKGLDRASKRSDIESYLNDSKNILIFTSRFSDAPDSNIMYQLKTQAENIDNNTINRLQDRSLLLVLPRGNEPEEKVGAEGNYRRGIAHAKDHVIFSMQSLVDGVKEENILFFNAKRLENYVEDKNLIIQKLDLIPIQLKQKDRLIDYLNSEVDSILEISSISKEAEISLISVLKRLQLSELIMPEVNIGELFIEKFDEWYPHWNTKHAINKRKGTWGVYDVFHLAGKIFQEATEKPLNKEVDEIESLILGIHSSLVPITKAILEVPVTLALVHLRINSEILFLERLQEKEFSQNNKLWEDLINDEIRGIGFTQRVLEKYNQQLHNSSLQNFIQNLLYTEWQNFIQTLLKELAYPFLQSQIEDKLDYELRSFSIRNFQGINEIVNVQIPPNTKCIFLTGENGYGKTSILRALAVGFTGKYDENYLLVEKEDTVIEILYFDREKEKEIPRDSNSQHPFPRFAAYGANRNGLGGIKKTARTYHLFYDDGEFINIEEELMKLEKGNEEQKIYYSNIRRVLLTFLEDYIEDIYIHREGSEISVKYVEKGKSISSSYSELAAGFKSVIGLIGDLIWRLAQNNYENLRTLSGIVIIDEFDLHLHPKWQKIILMKLNEIFPKVQFIISTHSPIPFLGAPHNSVIIEVNRDNKANITATLLDDVDFSTLQPNAILTSPIFKFESLVPFAHKGDNFLETDSYYYNIKQSKKMKQEVSDYLSDERTQEILALLKKSDEE